MPHPQYHVTRYVRDTVMVRVVVMLVPVVKGEEEMVRESV